MKFRIISITLIFITWFILLSGFLAAQTSVRFEFNCFTILAGKDATSDGSVMLAHNEDDYGDQIVNWYKVPAMTHQKGEIISMKNGGVLPQAEKTWGYLWLEIPGMEFSDSYMNEWGVTIGSDQCISKEKNPEFTDGAVGYELREAMASRAKTARQAVKIGGALIEKFGYASSGRTYCIADAKEAWMMSVVNGKHWVAQRIPDDEVAIIPNYYTITKVNLIDTMNYYGSSDLVSYALKNHWYDPDKEGEFNFRKAYGDPENLSNMGNLVRHWSAINLIAEQKYTVDGGFPFSFKPKQKVTLNLLFAILRNHNEGSEYDESKGYTLSSPHGHVRAICSPATQYGFVAQLRSDLPKEVAFVLWLAPFRPCVQPFIPWYFGIKEIPKGFTVGDYQEARKNQFIEIGDYNKYAPGHKFLEFVNFAKKIDENYGQEIEGTHKKIRGIEDELLLNQEQFENQLKPLFSSDRKQAEKILTQYVDDQIRKSLESMK
jgi:dipeptidase